MLRITRITTKSPTQHHAFSGSFVPVITEQTTGNPVSNEMSSSNINSCHSCTSEHHPPAPTESLGARTNSQGPPEDKDSPRINLGGHAARNPLQYLSSK